MREFLAWQKSLDVVPLLVELRQRADEIRRDELEKARKRLGTLTPEQEQALEAVTTAIVNKLLHPPTVHLKEIAQQRPRAGADGPHPEAARALMIRIGSRGSALALWQAEHVKARLAAARPRRRDPRHHDHRRPPAATARLETVGGKGAFLKEIEEALLAGEVDLAVHSLKDVPDGAARGPRPLRHARARRSARRALSSAGARLAELPAGARIGTTSLRRQAQLRALRPDLAIVDLRGNVDTRLRKLREGQFDAILLAMAGLTRLGRQDEVTEVLDPDALPARARAGRDRARVPGRRPRASRPRSRVFTTPRPPRR